MVIAIKQIVRIMILTISPKYMYGWGFATWKRVVDKYQIEWEHSDIEILNVVKKRCCCKKEITYWNSIFKPLFENQVLLILGIINYCIQFGFMEVYVLLQIKI